MRIKLTEKAKRGIGLRSANTGKLTRYEVGDELTVLDSIAVGLVNSGLAVEIEEEETLEETQNEASEGENATESEDPKSYEYMTKEELIAVCKEKGIASRGTKEELIERLTEE